MGIGGHGCIVGHVLFFGKGPMTRDHLLSNTWRMSQRYRLGAAWRDAGRKRSGVCPQCRVRGMMLEDYIKELP